MLNKQQTLADRLRFMRSTFDYSLQQFGDTIGFDKSYLSRLEQGKITSPSQKFFNAICSKYSVRREWLENGIGERMDKDAVANTISEFDFASFIDTLPDFALQFIQASDELQTSKALRIMMDGLSEKEMMVKGLKILEHPTIPIAAKKFWQMLIYRATLDKLLENNGASLSHTPSKIPKP